MGTGRGEFSEQGEEEFDVKCMLPPIGRRVEVLQPPAPVEVDSLQKAMDKVLADRAHLAQIGSDNATAHIMARGEGKVASKHGVTKVGRGVVDKFNAARHNTALMSAMGHPGLAQLVAKEEEEKRKRKARLKELTAQRMSFNGRTSLTLKSSTSNLQRSPDAEVTADGGVPLQSGQEPGSDAAQGSAAAALDVALPGLPASQGQASGGLHGGGGSGGDKAGAGQQPRHQQHDTLPGRGVAPLPSLPSGAAAHHGGVAGGGAANARTGHGGWQAGGVRSSPGGHEQDAARNASLLAARYAHNGARAKHGNWRRRHASGEGPNGEMQIRADSRVGRILTEFKGHDDWCSVTILKHSMATIIQANVRGWLARKRWRANPAAVVASVKAAHEAERLKAERKEAMRVELERRAMTRRQKERAGNVLNMLFGQGLGKAAGGGPGGGQGGPQGASNAQERSTKAKGKWNRLNKNIDIVKEQLDRTEAEEWLDSGDSDSDLSDMGVEDVALVKMRAKTPPWQKMEQSQWEGQWAKLNKRTARGNLDVLWDLSDSAARVQAVKQRRAEGGQEGGGDPTADEQGQYDPTTQTLPADVVNSLLVDRYMERYARMGLGDRMPMKAVAAAKQQQRQQKEQEEEEARQAALLRAKLQQALASQQVTQSGEAAATESGAVAAPSVDTGTQQASAPEPRAGKQRGKH